MYNLIDNTIEIDGKVEEIVKFDVWFQVPMKGLISDKNTAIEICKGLDLDPLLCIVPIPVAVTDTMYEILIR